MTLSILALVAGVLAYGAAGARLSDGAQGQDHPLRSLAWWTGTALQGGGFVLTLAARQTLPLLIVQAAVVGGLAVTAVIQHVAGTRALRPRDGWAIAAMMAGIAMLAASTVPGPAVPIEGIHLVVLGGCVGVCVLALPLVRGGGVSGLMSGLGFGISAIAARLLVAEIAPAFWRFWEWSPSSWTAAGLLFAGLVLGQVHLTRGLAVSHAVGVLGTNYLASTIVPAGVGWLLLGEHPRAGTTWLVVVGLVAALTAAMTLLRDAADPEERPPLPA